MKFIRIIVETAKTYYDEAFNFILMGSLTTLSCLLILPAPFTFGGMWAVAQRAVRGYGVKWHHYWEGMKNYGLRNLGLSMLILLGYIISYTNFWFYTTPEISPLSPQITQWILPLWLIITLVWTCTAYYANAFLVELKEPKLLMILRSSLFLAVLNPITTILLMVVSVLLLALSVALPIFILISPGMILLLRLTAVRMLVQAALEKQQAFEDEAKSDDADDESEE